MHSNCAKIMDLEREYKPIIEYEPCREGNISLDKVLYKAGSLFAYSKENRMRIKTDTYFYKLNETIGDKVEELMTDEPGFRHRYDRMFSRCSGNILVGGLGLGLMFSFIKEYKSIDVIEINPNVIKMISPYFSHLPNINIITGDIWEFTPKREYDYIVEDFLWRKEDGEKRKRFDKKFSNCDNIIHWGL